MELDDKEDVGKDIHPSDTKTMDSDGNDVVPVRPVTRKRERKLNCSCNEPSRCDYLRLQIMEYAPPNHPWRREPFVFALDGFTSVKKTTTLHVIAEIFNVIANKKPKKYVINPHHYEEELLNLDNMKHRTRLLSLSQVLALDRGRNIYDVESHRVGSIAAKIGLGCDPVDEANLYVQPPLNPLDAVEKLIEEWKNPKELKASTTEADATTVEGIVLPRFDSPCPFPSLEEHIEYLAQKFWDVQFNTAAMEVYRTEPRLLRIFNDISSNFSDHLKLTLICPKTKDRKYLHICRFCHKRDDCKKFCIRQKNTAYSLCDICYERERLIVRKAKRREERLNHEKARAEEPQPEIVFTVTDGHHGMIHASRYLF
jgi:hypothetical protein